MPAWAHLRPRRKQECTHWILPGSARRVRDRATMHEAADLTLCYRCTRRATNHTVRERTPPQRCPRSWWSPLWRWRGDALVEAPDDRDPFVLFAEVSLMSTGNRYDSRWSRRDTRDRLRDSVFGTPRSFRRGGPRGRGTRTRPWPPPGVTMRAGASRKDPGCQTPLGRHSSLGSLTLTRPCPDATRMLDNFGERQPNERGQQFLALPLD